jgi:hypothetical protein
MVSAVHATYVSPELSASQKPKALHNVQNFQKVLNKEINNTQLKQPQLNTPKLNPKLGDIRTQMNNIKSHDPAIKKSYDDTMMHLNSSELGENGTEIALKELAKQFENQIQIMMWNRMFKKDSGSLASRVWRPQLTEALVEAGSDELGDIGECVYEQLLEEAKQKQNMEQLNANR